MIERFHGCSRFKVPAFIFKSLCSAGASQTRRKIHQGRYATAHSGLKDYKRRTAVEHADSERLSHGDEEQGARIYRRMELSGSNLFSSLIKQVCRGGLWGKGSVAPVTEMFWLIPCVKGSGQVGRPSLSLLSKELPEELERPEIHTWIT